MVYYVENYILRIICYTMADFLVETVGCTCAVPSFHTSQNKHIHKFLHSVVNIHFSRLIVSVDCQLLIFTS